MAIKLLEGDVELVEINGDVVLSSLNNVHIQTLNADISAKNLNGDLTLDTVHGDASLRNISELTVQTIHGDLSARNVNGNVQMHQAHGDVSLRTVNGDVTVENGQRDINLHNLGGLVSVQGIRGDIRLTGGLSQGDHTLTAERDIIVRWPITSPLNVTATAPSIKNRLPLEKVTEMDNTLIGRLGNGETNANFTANGRIILKEGDIVDPKWGDEAVYSADFDFDFANLGSHISQQINEQVSQIRPAVRIQAGARIYPKHGRKKSLARLNKPPSEPRKLLNGHATGLNGSVTEAQDHHVRRPHQSQNNRPAAKKQLKILKMVEQGHYFHLAMRQRC